MRRVAMQKHFILASWSFDLMLLGEKHEIVRIIILVDVKAEMAV